MALKNFNPVTPSLRGTILIDRSELWKGSPVKGLTEGKHSSGGRNQHGRITVRFRGGGHKRAYRLVDFKRRAKFGMPGIVERLEYDPNRTAFIALVKYQDGELSYILAPQRLKAGDTVIAGEKADIKPGNAMPMAAIPVGTIIPNIQLKAGAGGKLARSAGTFAQLVGKDQGYAQVKLMSGELRQDRAAARPDLDDLVARGRTGRFGLVQQVAVDERPLPDAARHLRQPFVALRRRTMKPSVRLLLRVFAPFVGLPHGVTGCRPPEVRPSPPPCGWSTGFITTPR